MAGVLCRSGEPARLLHDLDVSSWLGGGAALFDCGTDVGVMFCFFGLVFLLSCVFTDEKSLWQ